MHAAMLGYPGLILDFADAGADVNAQDASGYTALAHAASRGRVKSVAALLICGADKDQNERRQNSQTKSFHGWMQTLHCFADIPTS